MKQIKYAIIGQGRSGADIHAKYLTTDKDRFKMIAVADPLQERLNHAKKTYNYDDSVMLYTDYHDIFKHKDLDLIINASMSHQHYPIGMEILQNGFNVLIEKPLANKVQEVDNLIAAAKKTGKVFAVFQQSRFAPYYIQIKKVIDSGVLGRIIKITIAFSGFSRRWDWQTIDALNAGGLRNTGPHPLDQALRFLDYEGMPEVVCHMDCANALGGGDDFCQLIMKAPGRPVLEVEVSSCNPYSPFLYLVQGSCGGLKATTNRADWKYFIPSEAPVITLSEKPIARDDGGPAYCGEQLPWKEESWDLPPEHADLFITISSRFYSMLYNTLTEGMPLEVTPEQVRQQIAVTEECHRQHKARVAGKPAFFVLPAVYGNKIAAGRIKSAKVKKAVKKNSGKPVFKKADKKNSQTKKASKKSRYKVRK